MRMPRIQGSFSFLGRSTSLFHCNGYLLLEILIAVAIFSIGFLAVGPLILAATNSNTNSNLFTQATLLATEIIESLKKEPLDGLEPDTYSDANNPIDAWGCYGGIFKRSWVIDDPIGYNTSRRIRVTVSWEHLGRSRKVELTTITKGNRP